MSITRCGLHTELSFIENEIAALNKDKAEMYAAYREQFAADHSKSEVKDELDAFKKAHRKACAMDKDADAVVDKDARVDAIVEELRKTGTDNAPRASRTRSTSSDGERGPGKADSGRKSRNCPGIQSGPSETIPEPDARVTAPASLAPAPLGQPAPGAGAIEWDPFEIPPMFDRRQKAVMS